MTDAENSQIYPGIFGKKPAPTYFCTSYDDNEAYKAHQETLLTEGLRYVCN